jgi:hypothetical protein
MKYALILLALFLIGCNSQPPPEDVPGHIAVLNRGDPAPFRGVLLNINDFYVLENK